jgi:hypothetical protein
MSAGKFRYTTVTAVVIANMVGTGVFTSLGFQPLDILLKILVSMVRLLKTIYMFCGYRYQNSFGIFPNIVFLWAPTSPLDTCSQK